MLFSQITKATPRHAATVEGRFRREILAMEGHDADGSLILVEDDEVIRPETTVEGLSQLRPVYLGYQNAVGPDWRETFRTGRAIDPEIGRSS